MDYLYIDEKGPQETIRMNTPYDEEKKIKLGNDNMYVYVADLIKINEKNLSKIEDKYKDLEKKYMVYRNFSENKELKGKDILNKNFNYGIASLKSRELDFYSSLFDLLIENDVDNLLFSINKMSLVVDNRLTNWILDLEEKKYIISARNFKYSLIKYLEVEASEEVIQSLFNSDIGNKEVLTEIQKHIKAFIEKNKNIKRMKIQIQNYKEIILIIKKTKHFIKDTTFDKVVFDWNKVSFDIDLWISEKRLNNDFNISSTELILDEGIPLEPFKKLKFPLIKENQDSTTHVGLRISDVLVVIVGKYMSKLNNAHKYDKENPEERKLLTNNWFELEEKQFDLFKKMNDYFFPDDSIYCFVVDTYFDDAILFESYFRYISSYETFELYNKQMEKHIDKHFLYLSKAMKSKWETSESNEHMARKLYGNMNAGIKAGIIRPL